MVLPLIIAGLAIDLAKALDRDSEVSAPKSKSGGSSHTSSSEIVNNAGNIPGLTIGRNSVGFTNDDDYYYDDGSGYHPEQEPVHQTNSGADLNVHVNPKYREQLMNAFGVIEDCGGWGDFTTYPIVFTSDDSSDACSNPKHNRVPYAHTDGERINICSCCWELTPIDLAFVLLHEWHHIHCRQMGKKYGGDREEKECDMYALKTLHRGGLTTQEIITRFVKPGD